MFSAMSAKPFWSKLQADNYRLKVLSDPDVRVNAVQALGEIGPEAQSAVADIKSAMSKKKDRAFTRAATEALKKIESIK